MKQEILTLKSSAPELGEILMKGRVFRHGESLLALPRELLSDGAGVDSILFELTRIRDLRRPSALRILLTACRLGSLCMVAGPCLSTLVYGLSRKWEIHWAVAFSTFLGVICLQISVNALNDVEDHLRLIDLPGTLGGSGVIQKGWMSAFQLNTLGYVFLGLGILGGLPAVLIRPPLLLCFGLLGVLGVLAYSGKPLGIKYRALGDLVIFVLLGPLIAMGFAQAVMGRFDLSVFCLGSAFGFLSCAILHANNFQDIEFDSSYGIRTLATSLGFQGSRLFFGILIGLSFVSLASGCLFGELPMGVLLLTCLGLPVAWTLIFRVFKASGPASALLSGLRHDVAKFHWIFGGLVLAGFVLVGFATQLGQW